MADWSRKMVSAVTESQIDDDAYAISQLRFPQKLWHLLSSGSDAILWGGAGQTILLNSRVLNSYLCSNFSIFKTRHLSSFIRQLNLYGFRKVTSHLQDPMCNSGNPHMQEYAHECFLSSRPDLLSHISRRVLPLRPAATAAAAATTLPKQASVSPKRTTALERARGALRSALARAALRLPTIPPPPPPDPAPAVRFLFTDLSDREEETQLDLELASRPAVRPFPYLAPHPPPPAAGDAAPYTLNASMNKYGEDRNNNRGVLLHEAEELRVEEEEWPAWLPAPAAGPAHPLHCALPAFTCLPNNTALEKVEAWAGAGAEAGAEDGGSDLKDLYYQISRTMDLLNS